MTVLYGFSVSLCVFVFCFSFSLLVHTMYVTWLNFALKFSNELEFSILNVCSPILYIYMSTVYYRSRSLLVGYSNSESLIHHDHTAYRTIRTLPVNKWIGIDRFTVGVRSSPVFFITFFAFGGNSHRLDRNSDNSIDSSAGFFRRSKNRVHWLCLVSNKWK